MRVHHGIFFKVLSQERKIEWFGGQRAGVYILLIYIKQLHSTCTQDVILIMRSRRLYLALKIRYLFILF